MIWQMARGPGKEAWLCRNQAPGGETKGVPSKKRDIKLKLERQQADHQEAREKLKKTRPQGGQEKLASFKINRERLVKY